MTAGHRSPGRAAAVAAAVLGVTVAGVVLIGPPPREGPPLDPSSTGPLGTRALVLLLEGLGADVAVTGEPPTAAVDIALVLSDDLDQAGRAGLGRWVRAGGTLVVAAPRSPLNPFPVRGTTGAAPAAATLDRGCGLPALADVERIDPAGGLAYGLFPGATGCFPAGEGHFVAVGPEGEGTVVAVGGAAVFTNRVLGSEDNAMLAAALLAPRPGARVAFVRPPGPGTGSQGLTDLVGDDVKAALAQLAVAFGVYAWWRGRRLGRPVPEPQPVSLAASELVAAVGNLFHQARRHDHAGALVRDDLRQDLARRLGLAATAAPATVAAVAAARTGVPLDRLDAVLTPNPLGDADGLVALAAEVAAIRRAATTPGHPAEAPGAR